MKRIFPALVCPSKVFASIPSSRAVSPRGKLMRLSNARSSALGIGIIVMAVRVAPARVTDGRHEGK
jgi:hypothetical protein